MSIVQPTPAHLLVHFQPVRARRAQRRAGQPDAKRGVVAGAPLPPLRLRHCADES